MPSHTLETCPQSPVLLGINKALDRFDKRMDRQDSLMERQAAAMEQIAAQGAAVAAHEKRLDSHDHRLDRHDLHLAEVYNRVGALEKQHAREAGAEAVIVEEKKFWTEVRLKLVTPALVGSFFVLWMIDKTGLAQTLLAAWKEFSK